MANEAVIVELNDADKANIRKFTVANAGTIEKGTFCKLIDPATASGATIRANLPCAGIAAAEKVTGDGSTSLAFHRTGRFDVVASGAVDLGANLVMSEANKVAQSSSLTGVASGAHIIGHALEIASDGEVFEMMLRLI